jgi:hypothetical protein
MWGTLSSEKQIPSGNDYQEGKGKDRSRFPVGMTNKEQGQKKKQIPCGNDNQEGKGKDRSRFPAGMTTKKAKARTEADSPEGNDRKKSKGRSSPSPL